MGIPDPYKQGSIPSIAEEYEKIPEKGKTEKAEFVNDIDYEGKPVHVLRYREEKAGETTEFQWLSSIRITKGECGKDGGNRKKALEDRE